MSFIWAILGFIIAMGVLVAIHEGGHFLVARLFNVKVLQFSLGFGKPFWKKQWGETEYRLAPFPLGGFVKFVDEREGSVAPEDLPRAFNRQSVYKRFAIVLAGPAVNLLFAWLAFTTIYFIGITGLKPVFIPIDSTAAVSNQYIQALKQQQLSKKQLSVPWEITDISGQRVSTWPMAYQSLISALVNQDPVITVKVKPLDESLLNAHALTLHLSTSTLDINQPKQNWLTLLGFKPFQPKLPAKVQSILPNSPASQLGLQKGDQIIELAGQQVNDWQTLVKVVQNHPNKKVKIAWLRAQQRMQDKIRLSSKQQSGKMVGSIGIAVQIDPAAIKPYQSKIRYPIVTAIEKGWEHNVQLIDMTLTLLKRMLLGEISVKNLSGPVSIAQYSGQAIQSGFVSFVSLLGLLSLSLGILNLLPIPVLDGGHLFFYTIEIIKGSPVESSIEALGQKIGLTLILALTFFAIFNDLVRVSNG